MKLPDLTYSEIVSTLAFISGIGALAWNIVRDFVSDRTRLTLRVVFGEAGNIKNSNTGIFAEAGSLSPEHKFDNPHILVTIVNTGSKPVVVKSVGGKLSRKNFSMVIAGLPKTLQPYEVFSSISPEYERMLKLIQGNEIAKIWVEDTRGKKWKLKREGWKNLKKTARYIIENKHV